MRGRYPKYFMGNRLDRPKTRVLIQELDDEPNENGNITSRGGKHILLYGVTMDEALDKVWRGLQLFELVEDFIERQLEGRERARKMKERILKKFIKNQK